MSLFALRRHWSATVRRRLLLAFPKSAIIHKLVDSTSFASHNLDNIIRPILADSPKWYVEAGANDGISQSNTKALELFDQWSGVLIEPIPATFAKLVRNRKARNCFINCALVSDGYKFGHVRLIYSNLMSTAVGLKSDIQDPEAHARSGAGFLKPGEEVYSIEAPARTLTSILDECAAPARMGLLSLDVEGAELEVLEGLNLEQYRFDFILIETRSINEISTYLGRFHFRLHSKLSVHDYLFADTK